MTEPALRPPHLLIVDDVVANRELLARRFELRGYQTTLAEGGVRALQLLAHQSFDLVLLDVNMPDLDGREVLRRIREAHSAEALPVIMVTARTESADVVEALSLGANDYITKPVDFAVAWARVEVQIGRKRAQEAAQASEERLRQAQRLDAVGQLAGGIAHDFNNLLLVIAGYTRLALRSAHDPRGVVRNLDEVVRATEAAEALIKKLSVFSRRELVDRRAVRVADALAGALAMLRPLLGAKWPVDLKVSEAASPLCVETDPGELDQAVVNLAINARDAMPDGGRITIVLGRVRGEPAVEISVRDMGSGIEESVRARIFDPFFTTKEQGKGTGLGLAMVYGFAQQNGGAISVESSLGKGSTFRLRLPCVDAEPAPASKPSPAQPRGRDEAVLVVEDNIQLLALMRITLEDLGYRVLSAADGRAALEIAADAGPIDLVVSDVVMPGLGGFELAGMLRQSRPGLPILFMSGYPTGGALQSVSVPEGALFLAKPFKPENLAGAVQDALAGAAQSRPTSRKALGSAA